MNLQQIAKHIDFHQQNGTEMDKITIEYPSLHVDDAYEIQRLSIEEAIARGDELIGMKMGLTSVAKQKSVGVEEAIYGRLTRSMELMEPTLGMKGLIHPRVEPEIAFVLKKDLEGENVTVRDVWAATECVIPALEVIDSRYKNFSFTLEDVVADNASSTKFLLGYQAYSPYHTQWDQIKVEMFRNGELVQEGVGAAVLDHPVRSVVELVKMLSRRGESLKAGMVIFTGAITEAINVYEGDQIEVKFDQLGILSLKVEE
ncbi:2-keto-4-pentenoate hydratase [Anaerobacillus alkaliphilus]|uniref:2-keto-4-pentenoate hydratase n=1 Tax=Anaerobacillus alkaliphilus TaxID=1548597 RepID=UPI001F4F14E1|nr:fumarylacetoacetate hydrolase family protein [Anaerobacillus alkaliphilus]